MQSECNINFDKILEANSLKWKEAIDLLTRQDDTEEQRNVIKQFTRNHIEYKKKPIDNGKSTRADDGTKRTKLPLMESVYEFNKFYTDLEVKLESEYSMQYHKKYLTMDKSTKQCELLLRNVELTVNDLNKLRTNYTSISTKTNSLHQLSEQLMQDQIKLQKISAQVQKRLHYFTTINHISQTLSLPTLSVSSETFMETLRKIDECIAYLETKHAYHETYTYLVKYRHCLSRAVSLIRSYVNNVFTHAVEQVNSPSNAETLWTVNRMENSNILPVVCTDAAVSLYYGKFQSAAVRVKPIIEQIEMRSAESSVYQQLLNECHASYFSQRLAIMSAAITVALQQLADNHRGDHSTLFRSSCVFMVHVCQDESKLFYHFFGCYSTQLNEYLETTCTALYDTLRPFAIHINHIETLAELCGILHAEMSDETNNAAQVAYQRIVWQLLQDVQERLVYRTNIYLKNDLLNYKPSAGDLAYPEKLEMMETISQSLSENGNAQTSDLHGMWYPTVKRTLVCLSRLYRCVDRPIFQGLSQEALTICVQTIAQAAQTISQHKSRIDGELFQIKHLLILREQIAPFQVDFCIKEMSLDFSNVKNAAYGLIQNRNKLFSLSTNNAILEFLLEGTPQFREHLIDSRKEVDKQLKRSCENFIRISTEMLIGPLIVYVEQQSAESSSSSDKPEEIAAVVSEVQRNIKNRLAGIQRAMQLYLSNRETEFILFRPIKNNVIGNFVQLEQILGGKKFSSEDLLVIACPTPDQVSILLSSASLLIKQESHQQSVQKSDSE